MREECYLVGLHHAISMAIPCIRSCFRFQFQGKIHFCVEQQNRWRKLKHAKAFFTKNNNKFILSSELRRRENFLFIFPTFSLISKWLLFAGLSLLLLPSEADLQLSRFLEKGLDRRERRRRSKRRTRRGEGKSSPKFSFFPAQEEKEGKTFFC